ncbi:cyclin-dependent kinase inhibitor far1 [Geranomyces variabilis]|nr:cyclin-dependent kinase inhibitor far1 [Geranomyces variabilis]
MPQSLALWEFYKGRSVFITGCTGFLAKALLEKLLRELGPSIGTIYLLIRKGTGKRSEDIHVRLQNEVLANQVFDRLRVEWGVEKFNAVTTRCFVPVIGDLVAPDLGIAADMQRNLQENVTAILHCAAVVDFDERLDRSMAMNVTGTLELIKLADSCKQMDAFVHVSTCYVNSHMVGTIQEHVYDFPFGDSYELYRRIQEAGEDVERLAILTAEVRQIFPNTYTFTKNMTEQLILREVESMRVREAGGGKRQWALGIVRASIIGAAAAEPFPGWIDGMAAAGAALTYTGLGVVHFFPGNNSNIADVVPVDHVSHVILAAAARAHSAPPGTAFRINRTPSTAAARSRDGVSTSCAYPPIYHAGISAANPETWKHVGNMAVCYWSQCEPVPPRRVADPSMTFCSPLAFHLRFYLKYTAVSHLITAASKILRTEAWDRNAKQLAMLEQSAFAVTKAFAHFTYNSWVFTDDSVRELAAAFNGQIQLRLTYELDWDAYLWDFMYGLHHYLLGQRGIRNALSTTGSVDVLRKVRTSLRADPEAPVKPLPQWDVGSGAIFNDAYVRLELDRAVDSAPSNIRTTRAHYRLEAVQMLRAISHRLHRSSLRRVDCQTRALLGKNFDSIQLETGSIEKMKKMLKSDTRVVYAITSRSHLDFLVLIRMAVSQGLPIPILVADQDQIVPGIAAHDEMAISFPLNTGSKINEAVFYSYIAAALSQQSGALAVFMEPERSRTGFLRSGAESNRLQSILGACHARGVGNITIVPVCFTYERLMEENPLLFPSTNPGEARRGGEPTAHPPAKKRPTSIPLTQLKGLIGARVLIGVGSIVPAGAPALTADAVQLKRIHQSLAGATPISAVNLAATVLQSACDRPVPLAHLVTAMTRMRTSLDAKGYWVDWKESDDSISVLLHSLRFLGLEDSIALDNYQDIWKASVVVNRAAASFARVEYAAASIAHVFFEEALAATFVLAGCSTSDIFQAQYTDIHSLLASSVKGDESYEPAIATQGVLEIFSDSGISSPLVVYSSAIRPRLEALLVTVAAMSVLNYVSALPLASIRKLTNTLWLWMRGSNTIELRALPVDRVTADARALASRLALVESLPGADPYTEWFMMPKRPSGKKQEGHVKTVSELLRLLDTLLPPRTTTAATALQESSSVSARVEGLWHVVFEDRDADEQYITAELLLEVRRALGRFYPAGKTELNLATQEVAKL